MHLLIRVSRHLSSIPGAFLVRLQNLVFLCSLSQLQLPNVYE